MKQITVTYIENKLTDYIWVRPVPKPLSGGHKALKNEDFIDHDDLMFRHSYYEQVVAKRLAERYVKRVTRSELPPAEVASNERFGVGRRHAIPQIPDRPLISIPISQS